MFNKIFSIIFAVLLLAFLIPAFNSNSSFNYRCTDCNVIFIGLDALQAKHVSFFGYPRKTTPELDLLASRGISFSQAISPSSWTVPTFMSVFTSTYPSVHKMVNRFVEFTPAKKTLSNINKLSPQIITVAQQFKQFGYVTGGFTGDAGVGAVLGYNRGFDTYTDELRFGGLENSEKHALKWLDENKGKKFFMFFHGYDDHGQFDIGDNFRSRFTSPTDTQTQFKGTKEEQANLREQGLALGWGKPIENLSDADIQFWRNWYDGKIRNEDDRLKGFIDQLNKRGLMSKTVIVIFSDHGTEFMEHGKFDHGHTLYDELINVPLVILVPGLNQGKLVSAQVSTLDIVPTVFDILGQKLPEKFTRQITGKSLVPFFDGSGKSRDVFTETDYRDYTHKRAVRTADGWKYIVTLDSKQEELFNLKKDPGEKNNLINIEVDMASKLRRELNNHLINDLHSDPNGRYVIGCLPAYPDQCLK